MESLLHADDALLDQFEKLVPQEQLVTVFPPFRESIDAHNRLQQRQPLDVLLPSSGVKNSGRYSGKVDEETKAAIDETKACPSVIQFNAVRASTANTQARNFLYQQLPRSVSSHGKDLSHGKW